MKKKILNDISIVPIIKSVLLGTVITLAGVLILAVMLKFLDMSINMVGYINSAIKIIAIFLVCFSLSRRIDGKFLLNSALSGAIYAVLNYLIFSIINGKFSFNSNNVIDIAFALSVALISSIIISLLRRKNT